MWVQGITSITLWENNYHGCITCNKCIIYNLIIVWYCKMTQNFSLYLLSIFIKHLSLILHFKGKNGPFIYPCLKLFCKKVRETLGNNPYFCVIVKVYAYLWNFARCAMREVPYKTEIISYNKFTKSNLLCLPNYMLSQNLPC